jgi:TetR/AcrR family transcriptional regulator
LFLYFSSKEELFKAVVRENISGRFAEWAEELSEYQGSSSDLVRYCMKSWWDRIGSTKASGIPKLMMSEAGNFPELARFFQLEVVQPGDDLIRAILQRGVDRGEFRPMDMTYAVYSVLAPMMFLAMWKHSLGTCGDTRVPLDPEKYIASQLETILHGLSVQQTSTPSPSALR